MSRVVFKDRNGVPGRPEEDRNGVPVRYGPIRTLCVTKRKLSDADLPVSQIRPELLEFFVAEFP